MLTIDYANIVPRTLCLSFRNDGNASRVAKTIALKTYSSGPRGGMEGVKDLQQAIQSLRRDDHGRRWYDH